MKTAIIFGTLTCMAPESPKGERRGAKIAPAIFVFLFLLAFAACSGGDDTGGMTSSTGGVQSGDQSGASSDGSVHSDAGSSQSTISENSSATSSGGSSSAPAPVPTIEMVLISAGTFTMGESSAAHSVTLSKGFYMGQYEVTQEQYQAVMSGNVNGLSASPSFFTSSPASEEVQAKRPVEMVSWYDVLVFCNRLNMLAGLTPVYSIGGKTDPAEWCEVPTSTEHANYAAWTAAAMNQNASGYRLPTEAEWEYACRAETTTTYSFGDSINGDYAWYSGNSNFRTHEVGKKLQNAWGLYDMHGNVAEWCWDWYGNYASGAVADPTGPAAGAGHVTRGGSWNDLATQLRSAYRGVSTPDFRNSPIGFRLVRSAP